MTEKTKVNAYDQIRLTKLDGGWKVELSSKNASGVDAIIGRHADQSETFDGVVQIAKSRYDLA